MTLDKFKSMLQCDMDHLDALWVSLRIAVKEGRMTEADKQAEYRAAAERLHTLRTAQERRMRQERERNDKRNNKTDRLRVFGSYA